MLKKEKETIGCSGRWLWRLVAGLTVGKWWELRALSAAVWGCVLLLVLNSPISALARSWEEEDGEKEEELRQWAPVM